MRLLALLVLEVWAAYLRLVLARIVARAPLHPHRLHTEREIAAVERHISNLNRRLA